MIDDNDKPCHEAVATLHYTFFVYISLFFVSLSRTNTSPRQTDKAIRTKMYNEEDLFIFKSYFLVI